MIKSGKKILISILTAFSLICFVIGAGFMNMAKADDTPVITTETINANFYMTDGATVRTLTDEAGIRWETHVKKDFVETLKSTYSVDESKIEFHTLINNSDGEFTVNGENVEDKTCSVETKDFTFNQETDEFVYRVSVIYDKLDEAEKPAAYQTELAAKAYVKIIRDEQDDVIIYTADKDVDRTIEGLSLVYLVYNIDTENKEVYKTFVGGDVSVTSSQDNGSLVSLKDGTGNIKVDGLTESTTYRAYIGAQYVGNVTTAAEQTSATVSVNKLPATYNGEAMTAGKSYDLLLLDSNKNVVKQPFKAVTKAISTAAELRDIFKITEATEVNGVITSATEIGGYYALANDIDWDETTHDVDPNSVLINGKIESGVHQGGFVGTFDGNGHVIKNMKVSNGGLFGLVTGGTIKNVAFTNVIMEGDEGATNNLYGASKSALAFCIKDSKIENVYVQANDISYLTQTKAGNRALLTNTLVGSTSIKNSIFRLNAFVDDLTNLGGNYEFGSLCSWDDKTTGNSDASRSDWNGVYVVSPQDYIFMKSDWDRETNVVCYKDFAPSGAVKRYTSVADMLAANNDYSGFDQTIWNVEEGYIPRFTAANEKKEIVCTETLIYEESNKKLNAENLDLSANETVQNITLAGKTSTYENGEWTINDFAMDGETYPVTVETNETIYSVNVRMVTKLLGTQQDIIDTFSIVNVEMSGNAVSAGSAFAGYYLLANDITWDSATTHNVDKNAALGTAGLKNAHANADVGLTGVFDGDGHTITGMKVTSGGLFGFVSGGTVKNVGFSGVILEGADTGANMQFGQSKSTLAFSLKNAKIENVYIQANNISPLTTSKTGNRSLVANVILGTTVIKDSIFRLDGEMQSIESTSSYGGNYAYGSLCGVDYRSNTTWNCGEGLQPGSYKENWDGAKTYDRKDWQNVYVISTTVLCAEQNYDPNVSPTTFDILRYDATTSSYVTLEAIKRYDSEEAFKAAEGLDLSGFDNKFWTVNTEDNSISWKTASEQE